MPPMTARIDDTRVVPDQDVEDERDRRSALIRPADAIDEELREAARDGDDGEDE
jgi:hypothetical protein